MRVEVKDDRSTEEINEYSHHHRGAVDVFPRLPRCPAHDRNTAILEYGDDGGNGSRGYR